MTTTTHVHSKVTAIIAMVFLLPALILFIMWISTGMQANGLNAEERVSAYSAKFPSLLQDLRTIRIISVTCCLFAIAFAARSFRKRLLSIRILMLFTVLAALFILLFDIYQML